MNALFATWVAAAAVGHPGLSFPVAYPEEPVTVGRIADQSYTLTWFDLDMQVLGSTTTVGLFYTDRMPVPFQIGTIPPTLTGTAIAMGIPEPDPTNEFVWDTSNVPPGDYFIYAIVDEEPDHSLGLVGVAFSRGVLTVAHPGDEMGPTVTFAQPDNPFHFALDGFEIQYETFDPDGSATVKLEVASATTPDDFTVLAEGLPALAGNTMTTTGAASYEWDTDDVPEGLWFFRATITDARGRSFTTFSRFSIEVRHFDDENPDAGRPDLGFNNRPDVGFISRPDAGFVPLRDAAVSRTPDPPPSSSCQTTAAPQLWPLAVLLFFFRRRRRRPTC